MLTVASGWIAGPARKEFKPKYGLCELAWYDKPPDEDYWEDFPVSTALKGESRIKYKELISLANELGCDDWDRLYKVCQDLRYGAEIGCKGLPRLPTQSGNAPSAYKFGKQVSDAIADWIKKGFAAGPYKADEVPLEAKINSIMCREKPNGSVRIILNCSAPAGMSVNDGIRKEDFPTEMSSTNKWLAVLEKVGKGAWMAKVDWSDAYKHIHVHESDLNLQWFSWLGKYFKELCLMFGNASSPGIYDRAAKAVLDLVLRKSKFPKDWVCQHLDDTAAACPKDSDEITTFDKTYQEVAERLGIKLAPRDDPEKAFEKSTHGIVFGVEYDTIDWTWAIPTEKLAKIADQIKNILGKQEERQEEIKSIVGRIIHVKPLVIDGRFHMDHLMELNSVSDNSKDLVELTESFKKQLYFWYILLTTCSGKATIPTPVPAQPAWAVDCYTDAAGGSMDGPGKGTGSVIPEFGWWTYMPWSVEINSGKWLSEGKKVSRKMSALELMGPLITISAASRSLAGKHVTFWVDNQGSCMIWRRGYSNSCKLSNTIVKAIATVAASIGSRVEISKITRCSEQWSTLADQLSQGNFSRILEENTGTKFDPTPAQIPKSILKWAVRPTVSDELGMDILKELASNQEILGINC